MGLKEQLGPRTYEKLHDPFPGRVKEFKRMRIAMRDDEPENSAPAPEVLVKPTLDELREKIAEIPAKKMGRPKSDKPRPWDGTGLSKSEYYRKKSKGEV
jgi:hypothetical protein